MMLTAIMPAIDPDLDLRIERIVAVPPSVAWATWTTPEHFQRWFRLPPYAIEDCEADVRPGGGLTYTMRAPGDVQHKSLCFLEVELNRRLIWTDALVAGYRPAELPFFTAIVTFEPQGAGTKYTLTAIHRGETGQVPPRREAWEFVLGQYESIAVTLGTSAVGLSSQTAVV